MVDSSKAYITDVMFAHKVEELRVLFIRRRKLRREMKDTMSPKIANA